VVPPDPEAFQKKIKEGYKFLAYSLDTLLLGAQSRILFNKLKEGMS